MEIKLIKVESLLCQREGCSKIVPSSNDFYTLKVVLHGSIDTKSDLDINTVVKNYLTCSYACLSDMVLKAKSDPSLKFLSFTPRGGKVWEAKFLLLASAEELNEREDLQ